MSSAGLPGSDIDPFFLEPPLEVRSLLGLPYWHSNLLPFSFGSPVLGSYLAALGNSPARISGGEYLVPCLNLFIASVLGHYLPFLPQPHPPRSPQEPLPAFTFVLRPYICVLILLVMSRNKIRQLLVQSDGSLAG